MSTGIYCPHVTRDSLEAYLNTTPKSFWKGDANNIRVIARKTRGFSAPKWVDELEKDKTTKKRVLQAFDHSSCGFCPVPTSEIEKVRDQLFRNRKGDSNV